MISLSRLSMEFHNNSQAPVRVFGEVNLHIAPGEFACIVGPSGCGKSTLLNLVAGFLKPTSGAILFDGRPVTRPAPERGVVFQDPTLFPWLTVQGNVEFGLRESGLSARERRQKVQDYLALVGLEGYEEVYPHALSGGMRQRVALARVLALEPKALLMDEPFSALDVNTRERLQDELLHIWELHRRTVAFVTHNVEEAAYLADRLVVMGFPPAIIVREFWVPLSRPRERDSQEMRLLVKQLRQELDLLPFSGTEQKRREERT
jgi:NitT/TauT family transport system ATP-binding protein